MPRYQLYLMNPHSGHIDQVQDLHAGDDVEAVYLASQSKREVPAELWRDGKKIVRIDGQPGLWARFNAGDFARPAPAPKRAQPGVRQTSTQSRETKAASRSGGTSTELVSDPAAGKTVANPLSDTSQ